MVEIRRLALDGVLEIRPPKFGDARGFFSETYNRQRWAAAGVELDFVQDNHSVSQGGVVRGLHYQKGVHAQAKILRCVAGRIFDVVVDMRKGSPGYGKWFGVELSSENRKMIYVPVGFAHGFAVLSDTADFVYLCTDYYHPQSEQGVAWDDPDIGIEWPALDTPWVLSDKDRANARLRDQLADRLPTL